MYKGLCMLLMLRVLVSTHSLLQQYAHVGLFVSGVSLLDAMLCWASRRHHDTGRIDIMQCVKTLSCIPMCWNLMARCLGRPPGSTEDCSALCPIMLATPMVLS